MKRLSILSLISLVCILVSIGLLSRSTSAEPLPSALGGQSPIAWQTTMSSQGGDLITDGRDRLVWATRYSMVLYDLQTRRQSTVAYSQSRYGSVAPVGLNGRWLVYMDDPEPHWTGKHWILKTIDLRTGKTLVIARVDPTIAAVGQADNLMPTVALSANDVIWTSWRGYTGDLTSSIHLFDLRSRQMRILAQVRTPDSFADVALSGHLAAWAKLHTAPRSTGLPAVSSRLWLDDLATGNLRQVETTHGASELSMWGGYLVYKGTPTRYEVGDLYLYNTRTRSTTRITKHGNVSEPEAPSVGASVVAWSELGRSRVGIYVLATHQLIHLGNGGRAYTAGSLLVYIAAKDERHTERGFNVIIDHLRQ